MFNKRVIATNAVMAGIAQYVTGDILLTGLAFATAMTSSYITSKYVIKYLDRKRAERRHAQHVYRTSSEIAARKDPLYVPSEWEYQA